MADCYREMPSELPKTLPDGTIWNWRERFRLFGARLADSKNEYVVDRTECLDGKERLPKCGGPWHIAAKQSDWSSIPIQSPPQEEFGECAACGGKACLSPSGRRVADSGWCRNSGLGGESVAFCTDCWSASLTYRGEAGIIAAILARRAAKEIKEGEWCSGIQVFAGHRVTGRMTKKLGQWDQSKRATVVLSPEPMATCGNFVWSDSLRREEEPKHAGTIAEGATITCGMAPAKSKEAHAHVFGDAPAKAEKFLREDMPNLDPYSMHRHARGLVAYAAWHETQSGIASGLTKREQAKEMLDRKYGPMGDRCRYGARLGGGWDTDCEEP